MIYYLCTYPRSGNSFLQALVYRNLLRLPSQFDGEGKIPPAWTNHWAYRPAPVEEEGWPDGLLWNKFTATYRPKRSFRNHDRPADRFRMIRPLGYQQFTDEMRLALSRDPGHFFMKSHHPPYQKYHDGEYVIQVVRHPGPTIWSYYRYLHRISIRDNRKIIGTILDDVIEGNVLFGGWAEYHAKFMAVERSLGPRYLKLDYEDLLRDQSAAAQKVAEFCGLEFHESKPTDFAAYDKKMVGFGSRGTNVGYEQYFTVRQLSSLWGKHGELAAQLGYDAPNLDAAYSDDQVERLSELVRVLVASRVRVKEERSKQRSLISDFKLNLQRRWIAKKRPGANA